MDKVTLEVRATLVSKGLMGLNSSGNLHTDVEIQAGNNRDLRKTHFNQ